MTQKINEVNKEGGVLMQIRIPRSLHHRIMSLVVDESMRTEKNIYKRHKVMEALERGVEVLEVRERQTPKD